MKPTYRLLDHDVIEGILSDARRVLDEVGVVVEDSETVDLLLLAGARRSPEAGRILIDPSMTDAAIASTPRTVCLHDRDGAPAARLGEDVTHFVPGSSALRVFDAASGAPREARVGDLSDLARLVEQLPIYPIQSTAIVPGDVPVESADRERLYHALVGSTKPIITGTFHDAGFEPMVRMLETVRGDGDRLRQKPLAVFDCCPTAPLVWPRLTVRVLVGCARRGIPAEIVPVPLTGATAPVTLKGSLVQIAAENLSGLVIGQLAAEGAPLIWGGCPMAFDMRNGTTPTGAPETMLLNAGSAEMARHLGLPSHAYLGLSDSSRPDMQAGFESGMGALTAVLAGHHVVSGAGMLSFIGCQSLEKLVFDAEICAAALRHGRGIDLDEADDLVALFAEAVAGDGFLRLGHTRRRYRAELHTPGPSIERSATGPADEDSVARCSAEVARLLANTACDPLPDEVIKELSRIKS
jgi:trimethylamine--corrinoid protein Co-methyltransferase